MSDNNVFVLKVDESVVSYIESLQYEIEARKNLLASMINPSMNIPKDVFDEYHKEYVEYMAKYSIAKSKLEKDTILNNPKFKDKNVTWNLDFETKELTITCA